VWELIVIKHQAKKAADAAVGIVKLSDDNVANPCIFKGYRGELIYTGPVMEGTIGAKLPDDGSPLRVTMVGTGESALCRDIVREVLWPEGCVEGGPCALDNVEHPPVDGFFFGMVSGVNSYLHTWSVRLWLCVLCPAFAFRYDLLNDKRYNDDMMIIFAILRSLCISLRWTACVI
jgi:hypothetical protein